MARRIVRIAVVALVLLAAGAAVLVATTRPKLADARATADRAWTPLVTELDDRYRDLATFAATVKAAGGRGTDTVAEIERALDRWEEGRARASVGPAVANDLESLAGRLVAVVQGSPRLSTDAAVGQAALLWAAAPKPTEGLSRFNQAVQQYQELRTDPWRSPVADVFGYGPRSTVRLAA